MVLFLWGHRYGVVSRSTNGTLALTGGLNNDKPMESDDYPLTKGWHHLVFCNENSGRSFIYQDTLLVATSSEPKGGSLTIAGHPLVFGWGYVGKIDDVRLYKRLLSEEEIYTLFNETIVSTNSSKPESGLSIIPNPAHGHFLIHSKKSIIKSLAFYDLMGKRLEADVQSNQHEAQVRIDYQGVVIVQVHTKAGWLNRKLILRPCLER